jgi:hypothetical protein
MAKKPDGAAAGTQRVTFTKGAAERIGKVVREVEAGNRDLGPLEFGSRVGAQGKVFRVCTFTGAWAINASKTVTFRGVTSTPNTVSAMNLVCGLNPGTVTCDVSIAKDGAAWYLVQPNLTQQPGYSGSGTQVLTIQNGSLRWVGTTACA